MILATGAKLRAAYNYAPGRRPRRELLPVTCPALGETDMPEALWPLTGRVTLAEVDTADGMFVRASLPRGARAQAGPTARRPRSLRVASHQPDRALDDSARRRVDAEAME